MYRTRIHSALRVMTARRPQYIIIRIARRISIFLRGSSSKTHLHNHALILKAHADSTSTRPAPAPQSGKSKIRYAHDMHTRQRAVEMISTYPHT